MALLLLLATPLGLLVAVLADTLCVSVVPDELLVLAAGLVASLVVRVVLLAPWALGLASPLGVLLSPLLVDILDIVVWEFRGKVTYITLLGADTCGLVVLPD